MCVLSPIKKRPIVCQRTPDNICVFELQMGCGASSAQLRVQRSSAFMVAAVALQCCFVQSAQHLPVAWGRRGHALESLCVVLLAPQRLLVLRGGQADDAGDVNAAADAMADAMADEMAEEDTGEELSENPIRDLIDQGCSAWDEDKDADRAEEAFKQALALDPTNADALCSMAVLMHESERDLKKAAEHFSTALEHSPEHVDSLHFYGNLLYAQQDDDAAELMYKRAVQVIEANGTDDPDDLHPLYVDTLCNHGALLERVRHDIDAAQAMYDKALSFDPQHRSVLFNYGVLLEDARKDFAAAEAMYRRALQEDEEDVGVLINLSLLLWHNSQDYQGAEDCLERALKVAPERGDVLTNYGMFLEEVRGDVEAAEVCYTRALKYDPSDIVALCHYGGLLLRQGKDTEANTYFTQARAVDAVASESLISMRREAAVHMGAPPAHL
jgi:Tfp pilus assembly protein PilF